MHDAAQRLEVDANDLNYFTEEHTAFYEHAGNSGYPELAANSGIFPLKSHYGT
jgi:hypothetical protein